MKQMRGRENLKAEEKERYEYDKHNRRG